MRYHYVVLTNPVEGREDEFNDWYSRTHVPDVLRIPGFVSAQRFALSNAAQRAPEPHPWRYFALYEIDTDDLPGVLDELARRYDTADMVISRALAPARLGLIFEPISDRVHKRAQSS